uniref:Uncharacterized protein n=1 Tax=Ixodes ricinus TaxID=34613 RepID=A0A6B0UHC8_IXORI
MGKKKSRPCTVVREVLAAMYIVIRAAIADRTRSAGRLFQTPVLQCAHVAFHSALAAPARSRLARHRCELALEAAPLKDLPAALVLSAITHGFRCEWHRLIPTLLVQSS